MPRFAANLSWLFQDLEFLDRFAVAARCGFTHVEFLFPYDFRPEIVAAKAKKAEVKIALFNAPPGDWAAGERGMAAIPGREAQFDAALEKALIYAEALEVPKLHIMAGLSAPGPLADQTYVSSLKRVSDRIAGKDLIAVIEPINPSDMGGYYLSRVDQAIRLLERIDRPNVKLQLDLYHAQRTEGDLGFLIERHFDRIGHVQIAGCPGRNEPDRGEINYPFLFDRLDAMGYDGVIGCEYKPIGKTRANLGWAAKWGIRGES
jgi:hydroxypyruvate isomerase